MDLLIEHGTWIVALLVFALGFIYLHVYPKAYPFLLAGRLKDEDGRQSSSPVRTPEAAPPARPAAFKTRAAFKSRP